MKSPRIRNPRRKPTELPRSRIPKTKMHYPKDKRFINNFSKDMKLLQEKEEKRYKMKCYRSKHKVSVIQDPREFQPHKYQFLAHWNSVSL